MSYNLPYNDEPLYSFIARNRRHRNMSVHAHLLELLGGPIIPDVELPSRINRFLAKSPIGYFFDTNHIILHHTMFPYYTVFLSQDDRNSLAEIMASNDRVSVFGSTGRFFMEPQLFDNKLKYCPSCVKEDVSLLGEPYWHRIHQIPGVRICPHHNVISRNDCPTCGTIICENPRKALIAIDQQCPNGHDISERGQEDDLPYHDTQLAYAQDCWQVLTGGFCCDPEGLRRRYTVRLQELEYAAPGGKIYQSRARNSFRNFYGEAYLSQHGPLVNWHKWLIKALRVDARYHPLKHLSIIKVLFGSFEAFSHAPEDYRPFGYGPWPCLNPLADHYKDKLITKCSITKSNFRVRGVFTCDCGYEYVRWPGDDEFSCRKVNAHGYVWETRLAEMLANPSLNDREIAKMVGLKSVSDYGADGKHKRKSERKVKPENKAKKIKRFRHRIKLLLQTNPNCRRIDINIILPYEYRYLLQNDIQWLNRNIPPSLKGIVRGYTANYLEQDQMVTDMLKKSASNILAEVGKPIKVTKTELLKRTKAWKIVSRKGNFPQSNIVCSELIETLDEYHCRCVKWAVNELSNCGSKVTEANVRDLLGIRQAFGPKTQTLLDGIIMNLKN